MQTINGTVQYAKNGMIVAPVGHELTIEELQGVIGFNRSQLKPRYRRNMDLYLGKHDILKDKPRPDDLDNRLAVNLPKYLVDTYTGYFLGIPPTIALDKDAPNQNLQNWLRASSFVDKLTEASKQVDIYGRTYLFAYQREDASTGIMVAPPTHNLIVYDDSVEHAPLAFLRYSFDQNKRLVYNVYYANKVKTYKDTTLLSETVNPYGQVPAVEFFENQERTGVYDSVTTLINALDRALSQKANQIEYFDNAYLLLAGLKLPDKTIKIKKDDGSTITKQVVDASIRKKRLIYAPTIAPNSQVKAEFLQKPDADNMQEHYLNRLTKLIYQISMVPDPNDESFSSNQSGVALKYKYLPMQNKAASKERKFTQSLRGLFKIVFSTGQVLPLSDKDDWQALNFTFTRNVPEDLNAAISAAKSAEGVVSHKTQLSLLPFVSDPEKEIKQQEREQQDNIKAQRAAIGDLTDAEKADQDEQ